MTDREAMKLALEAISALLYNDMNRVEIAMNAIAALRQALEESDKQILYDDCNFYHEGGLHPGDFGIPKGYWQAAKLFHEMKVWEKPAPPKREWQGLTDEDIKEGAKYSWVDYQAFQSVAWWAEEKLREKNGF